VDRRGFLGLLGTTLLFPTEALKWKQVGVRVKPGIYQQETDISRYAPFYEWLEGVGSENHWAVMISKETQYEIDQEIIAELMRVNEEVFRNTVLV
jgi:hypothetical protein